LNITPWLFQILNQVFITLEKAKDRLPAVHFLCDYHYRVRQLDEGLLRSILDLAGLLLEDKQSINIARNRCHSRKFRAKSTFCVKWRRVGRQFFLEKMDEKITKRMAQVQRSSRKPGKDKKYRGYECQKSL
jgi:hypothetical protein